MKELLQKYQGIFKLNDWDIQIIDEMALETEGGAKIVYNDYKAIIYIKKELSQEEKERSLLHELLHVIHRDEMDIVKDNIENDQIRKMYERFHERSIEKMAKIIYELNNNK